MVNDQLLRRDITDPAVLDAFRTVPRERFVLESMRRVAYDDHPLPIGEGQTISQPYVVAIMVQALQLTADDHVLEVGAGSGYAAAILGRIAHDVVAMERIEALAARASATLAELGYTHVTVVAGDGSLGCPEAAPFDAICVSAAAPAVPDALVHQLRADGRLVVPVGSAHDQTLMRIRTDGAGHVHRDDLGSVRFVPLVGRQGWHRGDSGRHADDP
jgi:protein-L-isoaspartate(D-aspartate) O-methyltransferase